MRCRARSPTLKKLKLTRELACKQASERPGWPGGETLQEATWARSDYLIFPSAFATACLISGPFRSLATSRPSGPMSMTWGGNRTPKAAVTGLGSLEADVALFPGKALPCRITLREVEIDILVQAHHDEAGIAAEGLVGFLENRQIGQSLGLLIGFPEMEEHELATQGSQVDRPAVGGIPR